MELESLLCANTQTLKMKTTSPMLRLTRNPALLKPETLNPATKPYIALRVVV